MPELSGLNLSYHLDSIFLLPKADTIYGYPIRKIYRGYPGYDFSVNLFGKTAGTPMGPAAGPHTQLAHNILLSYLAGSRIIELKTIQILDQLKISRPCIDMRNIGFNIEWSQELSLDESFQEYLHAWIMLHLIKQEKLLGDNSIPSFYDFIFDISVGYDLKGIQSKKVQLWLSKIKNAENYIERAIDNLPEKYDLLKRLKIPPVISDSVTLSTFHGCPADEIENIANHLIKENGFNVVIKLNPTLLGYEYVHQLLINKLGYQNIQLDKSAFDKDLSLEKVVEIIYRLKQVAGNHKKQIGVKFTNTLVVKNNENVFNEQVRYLSGAPLYVIAMHTMHFILKRAEINQNLPLEQAGEINTKNLLKQIDTNPYYSWNKINKNQRTINSTLKFFDCINCNICIPVCPNAANFFFLMEHGSEHYTDFIYKDNSISSTNRKTYVIEKDQQIGNIAEFCNDCGNCETFCPEIGAPYKIKPRFYINYKNFNSTNTINGFYFKSPYSILTKINGIITELEYNSDKTLFIWKTGQLTMHFSEKNELKRYHLKIKMCNSKYNTITKENIFWSAICNKYYYKKQWRSK
ncbi:MAG: 4Fe-4S dicluster domain-containing protein [Calditrichaceae bacterium]